MQKRKLRSELPEICRRKIAPMPKSVMILKKESVWRAKMQEATTKKKGISNMSFTNGNKNNNNNKIHW